MTANSRSIAAHVLTLVIGHGKSLDVVLVKALELHPETRDRGFTQELVYGVLRWYWRLMPQLLSLMKRRLRARDREIEMLLLVGLYQLQFIRTPAHAAVAETVDACDEFNKKWAKGLVNGTLRNAIRQAEKLNTIGQDTESARTAHPDWLVQRVRHDWPNEWQLQLAANNKHPPLTLRVNRRRTTREGYLTVLADAGIEAQPTLHSDVGIRLEQAVPVESLPDFAHGSVSVQDEAAQLANSALALPRDGRVLDACAAPGGKTAHMLETSDHRLDVIALDRSPQRVEKLTQSMQRLGLEATVQIADAAETEQWWDGVPFDRILLDAPCSGSGVIRRHPDIKMHRRESDIDDLAAQQTRLIEALWPLLKPDGKLVYVTCSILQKENDNVIGEFIEREPSATVESISVDWGVATKFGRQIFTGDSDMDGFYYARLANGGVTD
jgi:16S rRNA (cytosine967-C5)-methyltransferase